MKTYLRILIALLSLTTVASCANPTSPADPADQFIGRWVKGTADLPSVTLEVRREGNAVVGQVWLSGVTYTLPATIGDSSIVLSNPPSSSFVPFLGVLEPVGKMRAILFGAPDVEVTLYKLMPVD